MVPRFHSVSKGGFATVYAATEQFADAHDDWRARAVARAGGAGSFKFGDDDAEIQKRAFRVAAREELRRVDQRWRGTAPNDRTERGRAVVGGSEIKSPPVAARRAERADGKAGAETQAAVSELGKLFGLC